jgi:hypothetical protein
LAEILDRKRPLGRSMRKLENNIIIDLIEIILKGVDWIHLVQDRDRWRAFVNTVMSISVP